MRQHPSLAPKALTWQEHFTQLQELLSAVKFRQAKFVPLTALNLLLYNKKSNPRLLP